MTSASAPVTARAETQWFDMIFECKGVIAPPGRGDDVVPGRRLLPPPSHHTVTGGERASRAPSSMAYGRAPISVAGASETRSASSHAGAARGGTVEPVAST